MDKRGCFFLLLLFGLFTLLLVVGGIWVMIFSINQLIDDAHFLPGSVATKGQITSCTYDYASTDSDNHISTDYYKATVSFVTAAEHPVTFRNPDDLSPCSEGQAVSIRYHPEDPTNARIVDSLFWLWFRPIFGLCCSIVWFVWCAVWLGLVPWREGYWDWRRRSKQSTSARS